jgi:hypothetical protein
MGAAMNLRNNEPTGIVVPFPVAPVRTVVTANKEAFWADQQIKKDCISRLENELWQYTKTYVRNPRQRTRGDVAMIARAATKLMEAYSAS